MDENGTEVIMSRAAFTVDGSSRSEIGWICGSIFAPKSCFTFDGARFQKKDDMNNGHTDTAAAVFTKARRKSHRSISNFIKIERY